MMTNVDYGKRVRERERFNRLVMRLILGKDKQLHRMNIKRKAGKGVGLFADVTQPMTSEKLTFIRQRLQRATKEAFQREWIGFNPFTAIRKRTK